MKPGPGLDGDFRQLILGQDECGELRQVVERYVFGQSVDVVVSERQPLEGVESLPHLRAHLRQGIITQVQILYL